jgi:hypothetical protein
MTDADDIFVEAGAEAPRASPMWPGPSPHPRRRAVAQPHRLNSAQPVLCYRYAQGRAPAADGRWQGRHAHLHFYLPENWSPSYKFTVFEDSYVLSFSPAAPAHATQLAAQAHQLPPPPASPAVYYLARPLHGAAAAERGAPAAAEFELVWPIELDSAFLEAVEAGCDRLVPVGAKRKPHAPMSNLALQGVNMKLQRLDMS